MPKNVFIGFDNAVPPSASPAATRRPKLALSASLSEAKMYQPSAFWHHIQNEVARQYSPSAAPARSRVIFRAKRPAALISLAPSAPWRRQARSEEHTSELQSRQYIVYRLLLEKKKKFEEGF